MEQRRETWPHVGPMYCSCRTHVLFRWDSCTIQVGPTYYSGGTHVGPTYYSGGTHLGPTYPCPVHAAPLGPTYYLGGTHTLFRRAHVLFSWDPRILFRGTRHGSLFLKKYFFHYLKIQNIFNYSLYTNIIARLCILRSHAVALLLFGLCFHFINSKNIIELFIHR